MITSSYVLKAGICTAAIFIGRARGRSQARDKQRSKATHFLQDLNLSRRRTKSHETFIWLSSHFLCDNVHRANWVFAWAYDSIPGFTVTVFQTIITEAWHASRDGLPLEKRKISKFWDVKEGRKEGTLERREESLSLYLILELNHSSSVLQSILQLICPRVAYREAFWEELSRLIWMERSIRRPLLFSEHVIFFQSLPARVGCSFQGKLFSIFKLLFLVFVRYYFSSRTALENFVLFVIALRSSWENFFADTRFVAKPSH